MKWLVFCSQTGSEIVSLSKRINKLPDYLISNNAKKLSQETVKWLDSNNVGTIFLPFNPSLEDYKSFEHLLEGSLITLHGYLRIIPEEICNKYKLFNGHPGLVSKHKILLGKDPQLKAFQLKHLIIGSIIHKVIPEVDEGDILYEEEVTIKKDADLNDYYDALRETSLKSWVKFFGN